MLNSTYNLEEDAIAMAPPVETKPKRGRQSKRVLDPIIANDSVRSSDEFETQKSINTSAESNEDKSMLKGKKKRKLLSINSNSFFSPLV